MNTKYINHISSNAKDFILKALDKNFAKRSSAKQLLDHKWMQDHEDDCECDKDKITDALSRIKIFSEANRF